MIGRLVQAADFERVLQCPWRSRSAHFALHHLAQAPLPPKKPAAKLPSTELSTVVAQGCPQPVDDLLGGQWLGCVVPKRHARRAVTRSLLKRQIRHAFARHAGHLPPGQWLVRLRGPFLPSLFVSAASARLAQASRDELEQLLAPIVV
jgi:ribonuclease P protein component